MTDDDAEYQKTLIDLPYGEAKKRLVADKKIKSPPRKSRQQSVRRWLVTVRHSASSEPRFKEYRMDHSTKRKAGDAAISLFLMEHPDKCSAHVWAEVCSDE